LQILEKKEVEQMLDAFGHESAERREQMAEARKEHQKMVVSPLCLV
jgi:hypothetical protein